MRLRAVLASGLAGLVVASPAARVHAGTLDLASDLSSIEDVEALSLTDLLEQPTQAGSAFARKPADSPTMVSTVDAVLIEQFGYRTLAEALQNVRGIHINNDRNYSYTGIRGFALPGDFNSRVVLSIEGHRMNDPVYAQSAPGAELGIPMIAVERVEVLRGGAWSIYGDNALLGALHIATASGATRPGLRVTSTTRATAESRSDPAARPAVATRGADVSASYGAVTDSGYDVFVAGTYSYDPGLRAIYEPAFDGAEETCLDANRRVKPCDGIVAGGDQESLAAAYAVLRTKHVTLQGSASSRYKDVPTAAYGVTIGDVIDTTDRHYFADLTYRSKSARGDIVARLAYDRFHYHGRYPLVGEDGAALATSPARIINYDLSTSNWVTSELRGRLKHPRLGRHLRDLELAASAEAAALMGSQDNYDLGPDGRFTYLDRTDFERNLALSIHGSARAFGHLVLFGGGRAAFHSDTAGAILNPQAGLVLDGEDHGRLRLSAGRGYRAPDLYERFASLLSQQINPDLRPERSETREISGERYLFGKHLRVLAVAFHQRFTDLIALTTDDEGVRSFANVNEVHADGLELGFDGRWDRLRMRVHFTYQHVTDQDGATPVNAPSVVAGASLLVPFARKRGTAGVEGFVVGERLLRDGTTLPLQTTANVVVTLHRLLGHADVSLGVTNVLDRRNVSVGSEEHRQPTIPNEPRVVWLRLTLGTEKP